MIKYDEKIGCVIRMEEVEWPKQMISCRQKKGGGADQQCPEILQRIEKYKDYRNWFKLKSMFISSEGIL